MTFAAPVTGGPAVQGAFQQNITPANTAWAQQLEIWITPWGFLKGAAANNATAAPQVVGGKQYTVVTWMTPQKAPSGSRLQGGRLHQRPATWSRRCRPGSRTRSSATCSSKRIYSEYRDANGLKYPADDRAEARRPADVRGADPRRQRESANIAAAGDASRGRRARRRAAAVRPPAAAGPTSEKLADGVYRINGAYNALAIEFKDHIVLFEGGPQNEARSLAIIAEAKKVIPNKPIRYSILTHHHFDHSSGLPAVVAEGVTIITHDVNKAFLLKALSAPRTLAPDAMSKSGKKPKIEGSPRSACCRTRRARSRSITSRACRTPTAC